MNNFSISQLQQFSGIKAHTIRIWEQRYNALQPNRSEGNTRYYNDTQLRRLLNIVSLMDSYKVSELCSMTDEKLFKLINSRLSKIFSEKKSAEYFISQLIAAGMRYNVNEFDKTLSVCLEKLGVKEAYVNVIYPMLDRVGLMWSSDAIPPEQEHFISNIIRQKIFSAIDKLPLTKSVKNTWLLFLPEDEFHEIGLLFANFLIRLSGLNSIYLGANVPLATLEMAVNETAASNLLFFLVHNNLPEENEKYCNTISKRFRKQKVYVAGKGNIIDQIKKSRSVTWLTSVDDLEKELKN